MAVTPSEIPSGWKPDELDRYVLGMLYETGFMEEPNIRALYGLAQASVNVRINRLLAAGLIERRKPASDKPKPQTPYIYQLTLPGYRFVPRLASGHLRRHKPLAEQQLHPGTTAHKLAVANLAIAVATAPAGFVSSGRLLDWWGEHRSQMRLPVNALHPQAKSLLQPDGVIRTLEAGPTTWRERHGAPATSAWWVEVDRGSEDQRKWVAKIARYARAAQTKAWRDGLGDLPMPGLLVTVANYDDQDGDMFGVALWISHAAAAAKLADDWIIWIAQHRALLEPNGLAAPIWRQVQIYPDTTADDALVGAPWDLGAILAAQRLYPMQAWRERRRREEEDRRKAAASAEQAKLDQERKEQEQRQEQEQREQERQAQLAAAQRQAVAATPKPPADRPASPPRVAQVSAPQQEQPVAWYLEFLSQRPDHGEEIAAQPTHKYYSYAEQARNKLARRVIAGIGAAIGWLFLFFGANPTFAELANRHAHDYRELPDHISDYILCPQFLLIVIPLMLMLLALRIRWEMRYNGLY